MGRSRLPCRTTPDFIGQQFQRASIYITEKYGLLRISGIGSSSVVIGFLICRVFQCAKLYQEPPRKDAVQNSFSSRAFAILSYVPCLVDNPMCRRIVL